MACKNRKMGRKAIKRRDILQIQADKMDKKVVTSDSYIDSPLVMSADVVTAKEIRYQFWIGDSTCSNFRQFWFR